MRAPATGLHAADLWTYFLRIVVKEIQTASHADFPLAYARSLYVFIHGF